MNQKTAAFLNITVANNLIVVSCEFQSNNQSNSH